MSITASAAAALNVSSVSTPVVVSDSSANVALYLDSLHTLASAGKLASVKMTDTGTPILTTTAAKLISDASALLLVSNTTWNITLSGTATAAQAAAANATLVSKLNAGFAVSDTPGNVALSLAALQALVTGPHKLSSIAFTGSSPVLSITAASLMANAGALGLIITPSYSIAVSSGVVTASQAAALSTAIVGHLTASVAVSDTSANVTSSLDSLQARAGMIASITLTDSSPAISLTAAQLVADATVLLNISGTYGIVVSGTATAAQAAAVRNPLIVKLTRNIAVSDLASNVVSNLAGLQAHLSFIGSIALTDTTPVLSLTASQLNADAGVLLKISRTYSIAMTGTATVAQVTSANVALVSKVTTGFAISDTSVNVATNINALQASVGAILSIGLTDALPVLSLTAGQVTADAGILAKISGIYGVTVSDTASALYSNLSALQGLGSKLNAVSVGGTATAAQATVIAAGLSSHISGTIAVSDAASAVQGALDTLQGVHGKIASILVTSGTVAATAAQMTSDANIIGLLSSVSLSGTATVTQALAIAALSNLSGTIAVSDTASAVQGALDTLQGIHAKIASITVNGGAVAATATQMTSDGNIIGLLSAVALSGTATVTQTVTIAALSNLSGMLAVSDTASAVQGALDTLQGVHGKIGSIAVTGGTVAATATQMTSDASIIGLLSSVSLSGTATVAQAVAIAALSNLSGTIAVSDTASAVQGAIDTLQGIHVKIASITATGGTVAATAAHMTSDASVIGMLSAVSLSGSATVAQAVAVAALSNLTGTIAVSDTASAVQGALDTLQGIHAKIGSIAVTGGTIAATATQMSSDPNIISLLSAVSLSGTASASQAVAIAALTNLSGTVAVSDTAANVYAARAALAAMGSALGTVTASGTATAAQAVAIATGLSGHVSGTIAVSDTASGVQGALDMLQGIHAKIAGIAVTGGTVAATATQMTSDTSIIGLLSAVSLSGTATVTQAVAIAALSNLTGTVAVSDTASEVQGALDTLQGIPGKIASITVNGGAVAATATQMTSDGNIIGLLSAVALSGTATVSQAVTIAALSNLSGMLAVSDTASAVQGALDTLQGVHGKIGSIAVTGGTVAATATQMTSDASIIGLLSSVSLSGTATVAQAVAIAALSNFSGTIAVSDTASAVQGALDTLQGIHVKIASITATGGTVAATAAQMTSDASVIGMLSAVGLSGSATIAQTVAVAALSNLAGTIAVSDTASAVQGALDTLQGIHTKIASITATGGTIAATAAQMSSDPNIISLLSAVSLSGTASASQAVAIAALTNLSGMVAVSDTAANVYAARAALAAMGSPLGTVTASGTATAAQAVAIATGLSGHVSGTIAVSDTASGVQGALDMLQGIHAKIGSIAVTGGTVAATATQMTSDTSIIGLLSAVSLSGTATVTQAVAIAALSNLTGTVAVSDTASAVQGALDTLQGIQGKIAGITVNGGAVAATATQMTSDGNIIGLLSAVALSGTATVSQAVTIAALSNLSGMLAVSDTASAVQGALDTLQGIQGKIASITVTGGTVAATAAQMSSDADVIGLLSAVTLSGSASVSQAVAIAALSNLTGSITISGTSSAVQGALDTLQGIHAKIASIAVTGGTVSATATQISGDSNVISMLSAVSLSGSASVSQAMAIATLSNLSGTIAVSDTASTVQTALDTLQGIHAKIGSISVTGGTVTATATQMSSDAYVIGLLSAVTLSGTASVIQAEAIAVMPNLTGTIAISDTASAVQGALDTLQGVHGKIASITVTGGPVVATAMQMSNDADVIDLLSAISLSGTASVSQAVTIAALSNLTGTIAISDMASVVQGALDTLQGIHGKIGSIAVTGGTVAATAAQMTSDVDVIGLMSAVSLSGTASVSQAVTIAALSNLAGSIAISDTAATVQGALDTLQGIHGKISSIAVTGGPVTATAAQMTSDANIVGLLSSVSLSGPATATQAVAIAALSNLAGTIAVSDTASGVQGTLDTLQGIYAKIGSITVTAGTVAATATQMTSDGNIIGLLSAVSLSGSASVAQASAIAALSNLTGTIAVSDTASAVQGALDTLQGIHAKIASIAVTGGTVAATATQMSGDANVVALLSAVSLSGTASVTQIVAIAALSNLSGTIAVSDTASAVQGALDTLQGIHAKIGSVVISGGPVVATATQMSSDANVVGLLSAVSLSGSASVSQATAIAALSNLSGTIAISDTASAVQGALDTLQGIHGKIASITIAGGPVIATATQISADASVIGLLSAFSLSGTASVTQAVAIAAMSNLSGMIAISDTASAVQGALDTLQGIHGKVASIAVTGGTVAATAAQVSSDANVIGLLSAVSLSGAASVTQAVAIAALSNLSGTIAVSDTASTVQGALNTLQGVHGKIGSITVSSGAVSATAAQLTSDADVIALLSAVTLSDTASVTQAVAIAALSNLSGTIAISDMASAVQAALNTLQGFHAKIGSIIATGGTVAATAIQITSDTNVVGLLSAVSLSGTATVAQAGTIAALSNLSGTIAISDTSSAVQGALDTLQAVHARIGSIAITGGTVAATATQLTGDTDVIGLLSVVTLSGTATASQAVTIAALSNLSGTINVSDTGGNIVTSLGGLFTGVAKISTITVSDSATPLSVTSAALNTDGSVFAKVSTYSVTVSDSITAATADSINTGYGSHLVAGALTVSDTATAVNGDLSNLEALSTKLNTVMVTGTATAAQAVAIAGGLSSHIAGSINVSDAGSNIVTSLSGLLTNVAKVGTIAVSDSGTALSVMSTQLSTGALVFAKISTYALTVSDTVAIAAVNSINTGYGSHLAASALTVSDTATAVNGDLVTLTALGAKLNTVTVTTAASAAQAVAIAGALSSYIAGTINVSDAGGNIVTSLSGLFTNVSKIGTISVSDSGTALSLTSTQLSMDGSVFAKISTYSVTVSDSITAATADSINTGYGSHLANAALTVSDNATAVNGDLSNLEALTTKLNTVTVIGIATAVQAVAIASGLTAYVAGSINVSDSGANIVTGLSGLLTNVAKIGTIAVSDSGMPLVVTSTQLTTDTLVFAKISTYSVTVSDVVAIAAVNSINTGYGSHLAAAALTVSDTATAVNGDLVTLTALGTKLNTVTVTGTATAAQAVAIAGGLSSYIAGSINVSDTGGNIVTSLSGLFTNVSRIGSIAVTDSGTALSLTSTQLSTDGSVFAKISTCSVTVSDGITAATADSINTSYGSHLVSGALTVSDTAGAIYTDLSNLEALSGKLNTVTVTTSANAAQAVAIAAGLSSYIAGTINVSDTGGNIVTSLSGLFTNVSKIGTITVSDSGTALSVTSTALSTDGSVFAKISTYSVAVSDSITAATAHTINTNYGPHLASAALTVSDSATAVGGALSDLEALGAKLNTVTVTTAADAATAIAIAGGLSSYIAGTINVSDTGGNIVTSLTGLFTSISDIGTITVSDSGTALSVTSTQLSTDGSVFAKISAYSLTVSDTVAIAMVNSINTGYGSHLATGALTVSDTAGAVNGDLSTLEALGAKLSTVTVTGMANAAQAVAIAGGLSSYISGTINVSDTAANVYSALAAMGGMLGTVAASGTVMAAQAVSITTSLSSHISGTIGVSDTGANVVSNLGGLFTNLAEIGTITVSDASAPLVVTSTALATKSTVFAKIAGYTLTVSDALLTATVDSISAVYGSHLVTGALTVSDAAVNVSGDLDALQGLGGKISSISLTDSTPVLSLTAGQLISDASSVLKIGGTYQISVSGNATAQQATTANSTLVSYLNAGFAVTDTVADVGLYLAGLQTQVTANKLASIAVTGGGTIGVTAGQLLANSGALALISGSYSLTITSGTLTAAQATSISPSILSHLSATLPVQDASSNIVSYLNGLQGIASSIHAITFTDTTPALSLTAATISNDIGALSLASGYSLSVSGGAFTAAQAATLSTTSVAGNMAATSIVVVDTAANVSGALSSLATLAGASKLGPITLSDVSVLPVTPAQLLADLAVFRKITNNYTFSISSALTADQAASISPLLMSRLPANLAVTDSAAHVFADLDSLEALALGSHLGAVTLNDGGTPQLHVTGDQLTSDADALNDIVSTYQFLITGSITAAQAASFAGQPSKLAGAVSVLDTAAAVTSSLAGLGTVAASNLLSAITLTDTGVPSLSLTALAFDGGGPALMKIVGSYSVTITGGTLTVAQLASAVTRGLLAHVSGTINVSDSGAAIVAGLSGLSTNVAKIGTVAVSDSGTPLVVTSAALSGNAAVFAKISTYTMTVSDTIATAAADSIDTTYDGHLAAAALTVSDTATNVNGDLTNLGNLGTKLNSVTVTGTASVAQAVAIAGGLSSHIAGSSINVSDSGATIVAGLSGLTTNVAKIGTVAVSDSGTPLVVTSAALSGNAAVFAKISTYTMTVSDTIATAAADSIDTTYDGHLAAAALTVSDTATNVNGDLTNLGNLGTKLNSVTVTGTASVAQAVAIAGGLSSHIAGSSINVSDSGATIVAGLSGLTTNVAKIGTVAVSDSGTPLVVTSAALSGNAAVFAKISTYTMTVSDTIATAAADSIQSGYNGHLAATALTVSDTATNVNGDLTNLGNLGTKLNSVTVTGAASVAQAVAIAGGLSSHIAGSSINVSDSGATIVAGLSGLTTNVAKIGTVAVSDSGTPLVVTSAALSGNAAVFAKISTYTMTVSDTIATAAADSIDTTYDGHLAAAALTVSDTATNVNGDLTNLGNLGTKLNSVTVTGAASVAQAVAIAGGLSSHIAGSSINVSDSGATIVAGLSGLTTNVAKIGTVAVSDSGTPLVVTSAALSGNAAVFAKISTYTMTVSDTIATAAADSIDTTYDGHLAAAALTVSDTATNVNGDLTNLGNLGTKLNSVTVTGTASVAQAVAIAGGLSSHIAGSSINVSDSGATIVAGLSGLTTNVAKIGTVAVSDSGTPLVVTSAALSGNAAVFAKISTYTMTVSDTIATAAADSIQSGYNGHLAATALTVSDTATNVNGDLTNLGNLGTKLNSVTVTGAASVAQAVAIAGGLSSHIAGSSINVSDSGATIVAGLSGLTTNVAKIGTVAVSDSGTPLVVTSAALSGNAAVFAKISTYTMTVSDTIATAAADSIQSGYNGHLAATALTVSDTATNVNGDLTNLGNLGTKLNSVTVTGAASVAQAVAIAGGLSSHIAGSSINVSDSGATIVAGLSGLTTNVAKIGTVAVSDSGTPLVVTSAALSGNAAVFAKISTYTMTVSDTIATAAADSIDTTYDGHLAAAALTVSDTATNVNGDLTNLGNLGTKLNSVTVTGTASVAQAVAIAGGLSSHIAGSSINVSDSGATIVAGLSGLTTNVAKIGTVAVSDSGTPLVVTSAALSGNAAVFAKISTYTMTVSDTIATAAADSIQSGYNGHLAAAALTVSDTATNVNGDLTNLGNLGTKLNSVTVTGAASVAQAVAIAGGLSSHIAGSSINVSDSGATIVAGLSGLTTNVAKIGTVAVSDSGTPLVVTSAALSGNAAVFAKISTYTMTVSDTIATAAADSIDTTYDGHLAAAALTVSDTATNVNGDLTNLGNLGTKLNTVTVTGTASVAQAVAIAGGLNTHLAGTIAVSDTAARMMANIDSLQTIDAAGKLGTLTQTMGAAALTATVAQVAADTTAINHVMGATGANANAVLYIQGTSGADTVNTSALTHVTDISLGTNSATMSFVSGGAATVTGTADNVTLGSAASTVEYTANSGVEVINGFQFGTDLLNFALGGVSSSDLSATDITLNGTTAVAVTLSDYPTKGVVLVNPGVSASALMSDHVFAAGSRSLIS